MGQHDQQRTIVQRLLWPLSGGALLAGGAVAVALLWGSQGTPEEPFTPSAEDPGDSAFIEGIGPVEPEVIPYVPADATVAEVEAGERIKQDPALLPDGLSTVRVGPQEWAVVSTGQAPQERLLSEVEHFLATSTRVALSETSGSEGVSAVAIALEAQAVDFAAAFDTQVIIVYPSAPQIYTAWSARIAEDGTLEETWAHEDSQAQGAIDAVSGWLAEQDVDENDWVLLDLVD